LGVHRNTVKNYMKEYGITKRHSDMTPEQLDDIIRQFRQDYPDSGIRYAHGYVRDKGHFVQ
ncbi:hypothetical protein SISSUDRAFT_967862, partial [Sistotremastrum suecicum HHB10207 ss-3]